MARATWNPDAARRYTRVAIVLHWLIALAILYNLTSGLLGRWLPYGFFIFHISSGISILVLSVVRVLWRLTHRPPPLLPMAWWERALAHGVHVLLYAAMLVLPLSGWAMVSAHPPVGSPGYAYAVAQAAATGREPPPAGPQMIWGVLPLPAIAPVNDVGRTADGVPRQDALHERIETFHLYGGWVLLLLLVLHVAGALKHQFVDRERELARMGLGTPHPVR